MDGDTADAVVERVGSGGASSPMCHVRKRGLAGHLPLRHLLSGPPFSEQTADNASGAQLLDGVSHRPFKLTESRPIKGQLMVTK